LRAETTRGRGQKGRALRSRGHAARLLFLSRHVRARRRGLRGGRKVSQAGRRSLTAPKGEPAGGPGWGGAGCPLRFAVSEAGGGGGTSHSPTGSGPEGSSPNERGSGRSSASHPSPMRSAKTRVAAAERMAL